MNTTAQAVEAPADAVAPVEERDIMRIPHLLAAIERYWMQNPQLRLGQIVENFTPDGQNSYFVEDEVLIEKLREAAPGWH